MDPQSYALAAAAHALLRNQPLPLSFFFGSDPGDGNWTTAQLNTAINNFVASSADGVWFPKNQQASGILTLMPDGARKKFFLPQSFVLYQSDVNTLPWTIYTLPKWIETVTLSTVTGVDLNDNDADAQPANTVVKAVLAASHTWNKYDAFKLVSDDGIAESQTAGTSSTGRLGEYVSAGQSSAISGGTNLITTALCMEPNGGVSAYATNPRIAALSEAQALVYGGSGDYPQANESSTVGTLGLIGMFGMTDSHVYDFTPNRALSVAVIMQGCLYSTVDNPGFHRQRNSPALNQYGYGVRLTGSIGCRIKGGHARGVRHFTTSADFPVTSQQTGFNIHQYGRTWMNTVQDAGSEAGCNAGHDFHDAGYMDEILNCTSDRCFAGASGNGFGFNLRGVKSRLVNGRSLNNRAGVGFTGKRGLVDGGYYYGNQYALSWNASTTPILFGISGECRDAIFESPYNAASAYGQGQTESVTVGTFTAGSSVTVPITGSLHGNGTIWARWTHSSVLYEKPLANAVAGATSIVFNSTADTNNISTGDVVTIMYTSEIKEKNCKHVVSGNGAHSATFQFNYPCTFEAENLTLDYSGLSGSTAGVPFAVNSDGVTIKIKNLRVIPGSNTWAALYTLPATWSGTTSIEIENILWANEEVGQSGAFTAVPMGAASNPFSVIPSTDKNVRVSGIQKNSTGEWNTNTIIVAANSYTSTPLPIQGRMDDEITVVYTGDTAAKTLASWSSYVTGSQKRNQTITHFNNNAYPVTVTSLSNEVIPPYSFVRVKYNNSAGTFYIMERGGGRRILATNGANVPALGDSGAIMELNNATPSTSVFPNTLPQGWECDYVQVGAGAYTFTAGGTLQKKSGLTGITNGQYSRCKAYCRSNVDGVSAVIELSGDLT